MAPPVVKRSSASLNPVYDGAQFLLVVTWLAPYFVQIPVNANIIVTSTLILYVVSNTLTKKSPSKYPTTRLHAGRLLLDQTGLPPVADTTRQSEIPPRER